MFACSILKIRIPFRPQFQYIRNYSTNVTSSLLKPSQIPQTVAISGKVLLPRTPLAIYGQDSAKFINGLLPIRPPEVDVNSRTKYTTMLNSSGRVTADLFITCCHDNEPVQKSLGIENQFCYILDLDHAAVKTALSVLNLHALTADVEVKLLPDYEVYSLWDDVNDLESYASKFDLFTPDPRVPGFGNRVILPKLSSDTTEVAKRQELLNIPGLTDLSIQDYNLRRYLFGLPEGSEYRINKSLPLEYCVDYMGGIDFDKGCYLGQELVCRMHQQNMVRKRVTVVNINAEALKDDKDNLIPNKDQEKVQDDVQDDVQATEDEIYKPEHFQLDPMTDIIDTTPAPHMDMFTPVFGKDSNVFRSKAASRPSGKLIDSIGNIGLAILRTDTECHNFKVGDYNLTPIVPFWWPVSESEAASS